MVFQEISPPEPPPFTFDEDVNRENIAIFKKNCQIYTELTGKAVPPLRLPQPPQPPHTPDPLLDQQYRLMYGMLCNFYRQLTGQYPPDYMPPVPL